MAVTFIQDLNTLTFPDDQQRQYPLDDALGQKGVLMRTKGGVMAVDVRKAGNPLQIPLSLVLVDQTFFSDLDNWFFNICQGKLYKFYYSNTVTGESSMPVRWVNG